MITAEHDPVLRPEMLSPTGAGTAAVGVEEELPRLLDQPLTAPPVMPRTK